MYLFLSFLSESGGIGFAIARSKGDMIRGPVVQGLIWCGVCDGTGLGAPRSGDARFKGDKIGGARFEESFKKIVKVSIN